MEIGTTPVSKRDFSTREAKMSTSRLFSLFVALALVVVVALTVQAGITTSKVVSSPQAVLDQHERHPAFVNSSAPSAAVAEQARLEYRRGEWNASQSNYAAALDQHERHINLATSAEQARLDYRRGEWNAGNTVSATAFDVEQTRIGWHAGK
jgi:hypothetical protein